MNLLSKSLPIFTAVVLACCGGNATASTLSYSFLGSIAAQAAGLSETATVSGTLSFDTAAPLDSSSVPEAGIASFATGSFGFQITDGAITNGITNSSTSITLVLNNAVDDMQTLDSLFFTSFPVATDNPGFTPSGLVFDLSDTDATVFDSFFDPPGGVSLANLAQVDFAEFEIRSLQFFFDSGPPATFSITELTAVPLPAAAWLFLSGLLALAIRTNLFKATQVVQS